jgi:hypothetical protein
MKQTTINQSQNKRTKKKAVPKIVINRSNNFGECGLIKNGQIKYLYFPFFLLGACGDERGVLGRHYFRYPKIMNYEWFKSIANIIKENPYFDWDWNSFCNNVIKPNKEHLKVVLKLDDSAVDRFIEDGYVFINHFEDEASEEYEEMRLKGEVGYICNFKNFLEHPHEVEY